jgi:hypothetical protein
VHQITARPYKIIILPSIGWYGLLHALQSVLTSRCASMQGWHQQIEGVHAHIKESCNGFRCAVCMKRAYTRWLLVMLLAVETVFMVSHLATMITSGSALRNERMAAAKSNLSWQHLHCLKPSGLSQQGPLLSISLYQAC